MECIFNRLDLQNWNESHVSESDEHHLELFDFGIQEQSQPDLIVVIFSPQMYFLGSIFLHMKARKLWQNFPKISHFFQNIPKFLHIWRNFNFPHNCYIWKAEISPQEIFSSQI